MVGDMGNAILFMVCLAGTAIVAAYVGAYAAHCLLVVVQGTAAGQDAVTWPDEPVMDWLGQAVYVGFLLALWLAPAGLLARGLRHVWLPGAPGLRTLLLAVPGLWLFFPVGLLSSMSAVSPWVPFRLVILGRLLRLLPATLAFYVVSALLAAGVAYPWYLTVGRLPYLLPAAALVSAGALLLYARLLGRLAWLVGRLSSPRSSPLPSSEKPRPRRKRRAQVEVEDPWAVPPHLEAAKKKAEDKAAAAKRKKRGKHEPPLPDEIEAYGLAPAQPNSAMPSTSAPAQAVRTEPPSPPAAKPDSSPAPEVEKRFRDRPPEYIPRHPLLEGVYTFPFYSQSIRGLIGLSVGFLALGLGLLGMASFWPK